MLPVVALVAVASLQTPAPIRGFPSSMVSDQVRRERTARLVPNPDTLRTQHALANLYHQRSNLLRQMKKWLKR